MFFFRQLFTMTNYHLTRLCLLRAKFGIKLAKLLEGRWVAFSQHISNISGLFKIGRSEVTAKLSFSGR